MNKSLLLIAFITSFFMCSAFTFGQAPDTIPNAFGLVVKQSCYLYSECSSSNPKPKYNFTEVKMARGSTIINDLSMTIDAVDEEFKLNRCFYLNSKDGLFYSNADWQTEVDTISVRLRIESMPRYNDKTTQVKLTNNDEPINVHFSAGTHCGWSRKKEGYNATTTIYIDDPVDILSIPGEKTRYSVASETVPIKVSNFYDNGREVKLQYALQSNEGKPDNWEDINVTVKPNTTIHLPYWRIVGNKSASNPKYFNYLGRGLKFRVVKKLANGTVTYGNVLSNVVFYPEGLQFSITDLYKPYCAKKGVSIIVELKNSNDVPFAHNFNDSIKWKMVRLNELGDVDHISTCTMLDDGDGNDLTYVVRPDSIRFIEYLESLDNQEEVVCGLMLEDQRKELERDYCKKEFTIPARRKKISIWQSEEIETVNGGDYHLLSSHDPYAVVYIDDANSYNSKQPTYTLKVTDSTEVENVRTYTVNGIPPTYENLSPTEQKDWDKDFEADFENEIAKANGEWASFLKYKHNVWYSEQAEGVVYTGSVPSMSYKVNLSYTSLDEYLSLFKPDKKTHYYGYFAQNGFKVLRTTFIYDNTQVLNDSELTTKDNLEDWTDIPKRVVEYYATNSGLYVTGSGQSVSTVDDGTYTVIGGGGTNFLIKDPDVNWPNRVSIFRLYRRLGDSKFVVADDCHQPFLSSGGSICLYTPSTKFGLYASGGKDFTYLTGTKLSSRQIDQINYIDNSNTYCIFKSGANYYKRTFIIKSYDDLYNELKTAGNDFNGWKSEFRDKFWKKWLLKKTGFHLKGLKANYNYKLTLIDGDSCAHTPPIDLIIKVPPQARFDTISVKIADNNCATNGEVVLEYKGGGEVKYLKPGDQVILSGLERGSCSKIIYDTDKGKEIGEYKDYFPLDCLSISTYSVTSIVNSETSIISNGQITISYTESPNSLKTYTLQRMGGGVYTETTTKTSHSFTNLPHGIYNATVIVDGCSVPKNGIVINNNTFALVPTVTHSNTFNGKGSVVLKATNRHGSITWEGVPPSGFPTSMDGDIITVHNIKPATYNFTAVIKDEDGRTIKQPVSFKVEGPSFTANISINYFNDKANINASLSDVIRLSGASLYLYKGSSNVSPDNSGLELSAKGLSNGTYDIKLEGSQGSTLLYSFTVPVSGITVQESITNPKCQGEEGSMAITATGGLGANNFTYSADNVSFVTDNTIRSKAGTVGYFVKDTKVQTTQSTSGNVVNVNESVVSSFTTVMNEPLTVGANRIIPSDVSCKGLNDGSVEISHFTGGNSSTKFQLMVNNSGAWVDTTHTIDQLKPGTYEIHLKDVANECEAELLTQFEIYEPDTMLVENYSIGQPICELDNGSIEAEITGGSGYYKYEWIYKSAIFKEQDALFDTTAMTSLGDTLRYGTYQLKVSDSNGCKSENNLFELEQYYNPQVERINLTDVRCFGEANGEIKIDSVSGSIDLNRAILSLDGNKLDSISELTSSFTGLVKGNYHLSVIDNNGCSSNQPYTAFVHQPDKAISVSIDTIRPVIDKGSNTGFIALTTDGGNIGEKTVVVSDVSSAVVTTDLIKSEVVHYISQLSADEYTVTVSDEKGCSITETNVEVIEPALPLSFTITEQLDARCKAQTGGFTVEGTGGWGGYAYKRASDAAFYPLNEFNNLYAGRYLLSVKDRLGAVFTDTVKISEPKDSLQVQLIDVQSASCNVGGQISVKGQGGTGPYRYVLNQGVDTIDVAGNMGHTYTNLTNRPYLISAIDDNGCRADMDVALDDQLELKGLTFKKIYPSTVAAVNGQLSAVVEGGQAPFSFVWKKLNGSTFTETGSELTGIGTGFYTATVYDAGGCSMRSATLLEAVTDSVLMVIDRGDETGYQKADGYIEYDYQRAYCQSVQVLYPDGRLVSFNGDEVNGLFNANGHLYLSNLTGGQYHVLLTAVSGQNYTSSFAIEAYQPLTIAQVERGHVSQKNGGDGAIKLTISGGAAPFVFDWIHLEKNSAIGASSSAYVSSLDKLTAGTYQVTVTDRYNNVLTEEVNILEPAEALTVSIKEYRNESCKTYEDAYVVLQANGGWGDYQFRHDSVEYFVNAANWLNLDVRNHTFYLTDRLGNIDSLRIAITEPDYLHAAISLIDSVDCKGDANGVISFNVTGGTAPYRYNMASQPQLWVESTRAENLLAGDHTFYFTDANNCIGQDTLKAYMPEPDELLFNQQLVTHTTCNTDNGVITVAMQGGSAPYNYEWRNEASLLIGTDSVITSLAQNGLYTLDVYDYHGCHQQLEQRIKPSTLPLINTIATTPVLCYGDSTGTATVMDVTPAEPFAPYGFTWSNGQTDDSSTKWTSEMHHVTIADTNGCETTKWFMIDTPDSLRASIESIKHAHCFGYNDGFIKLLPQGGVGAYQFTWSNGDTEALADSLSKGDYKVLLTDGNACEYERTISIVEPDELIVDLGEGIKICPDNTIVIDGQDFTTHRWYNDEGDLLKERFIEVGAEDDYYLEVTNDIGCFARDTITLTIGNDALQADFLMTSEAYLGDTLRVYELSNMPLDSLNWDYSGNAFLNVKSADMPDYVLHLLTLEDGMYNVSLQAYSGGCISKMVKQVEVFELDGDQSPDVELGYQEPLIQSLKVAPNPTDGNFSVLIELREQADVHLSIYNINQALKVNEREQYGQSEYTIDYQLSGLSTGVYLVVVTAENERKQIKIVIN
ncbi:T9SS type A sorting domain-containing protein [Carboxylicivirga taeanensis]|uniref:T9SS type A sorting domain-containing protein n=1 Tax=Carboxylicivirga taeanensis TaxID=1416875 RepID=UPI003F6DB6EF